MPDVYKITPLETFAKEIIPAAVELLDTPSQRQGKG